MHVLFIAFLGNEVYAALPSNLVAGVSICSLDTEIFSLLTKPNPVGCTCFAFEYSTLQLFLFYPSYRIGVLKA